MQDSEAMELVRHRAMSTQELAERWRERNGFLERYEGQALSNHWNIAFLTGVGMISLVSGSLPVLLVGGLLEAGFIGLLPRTKMFRKKVDEYQAWGELTNVLRLREGFILRMDDVHRDRYEVLEIMVRQVQEAEKNRVGAAEVDRHQTVENLLAAFVDLAVKYHEGQQYLNRTSRRRIERELSALKSKEHDCSSVRQQLHNMRLDATEKRLDRWDRTREYIDTIEEQLKAIFSVIQLTHEQVLSPDTYDDTINNDIEGLLSNLQENMNVLTEAEQIQLPAGNDE